MEKPENTNNDPMKEEATGHSSSHKEKEHEKTGSSIPTKKDQDLQNEQSVDELEKGEPKNSDESKEDVENFSEAKENPDFEDDDKENKDFEDSQESSSSTSGTQSSVRHRGQKVKKTD